MRQIGDDVREKRGLLSRLYEAYDAAAERLNLEPERRSLIHPLRSALLRMFLKESPAIDSLGKSPVARDEPKASHLVPAEAVLQCATCHAERDAHRGMFGSDCGACHGASGWVIPEYRHPSNASTDCAQCHRAPPCHLTSHFTRVCGPVAGKPNAEVRDCHSCHQVTAWNNIKGFGWYQSH